MTIKITDVPEPPVIMVGGLAISGMARVDDYAENGTGAVAMYTASGPDAASAMWSLEGDDAGQFSIPNGMLMFMTAPDYEMPMDMGGDNMYMVTVMATDGTYMDTQDVTVKVTNVEEAPEFDSATTTRSVVENTAAGENIGEPVAAMDDDAGDTLTYTLGGTDMDSFDIDEATGQLMTMAAWTSK